MKQYPKTLAISAVMAVSAQFASADTGRAEPHAVACFSETQRIGNSDDARPLSTIMCDLALKTGPYTDEHRASVLFNRALIESAQGEYHHALASLNKAVELDPDLLKAVIAKAQTAHRLGDYDQAIAGYVQLLEEHARDKLVRSNKAKIEHNLASARESLMLVAAR